jgi:iron(III) transport system ATP-binding protein
MAMVFQSYAIFPHLNVYENIAYGLKIKKLSATEIQQKVDRVLKLVELGGLQNRAPNQISGGQQQRVALARALVVEPKVLLFDEPLSNLDAKLREEMRFEVRDLQKRLGITAIYVTHDQQEALVMSDKIAVMNNGRLVQLGTPEEIYERPQSKFVAEFIGLSDFILVRVESFDASQAQVTVGSSRLTVPAIPGLANGQTRLLFIRPNDLEFADGSSGKNVLAGTIRQATYLGEQMDYRVEIEGGLSLRVDSGSEHRYSPGDRVGLHLPAARCQLLAEA